MATRVVPDAVRYTPAADASRPNAKPVKYFAVLGCAFLAAYAYSVTRWLLGGHAKASPIGADALPTWMVFSLRAHEIVFGLVAVFVIYIAIVRPWLRERRLTADGMVLIAFATMWGQDNALNYTAPFFTYNAGLVNLGCPQCFLPGYMAPMQTAAEPFFFVWAFYFGLLWLLAKAGMKVMRWSEAKWPHLGRLGLAVILYGSFLVFDLVTEVFWIRLGLYSYEGATGPFVLFPGHYYQLPIFSILLGGVWYSSIIMLWYYRNDKGQTLVERGADQLRGSARRSRGVRILALIGGFNLLFALLYNLPLTWISAESNKWPEDTYTRSYFTQGICGPGTDTACPDGRLPLTREGSARISPDGALVAPRGLPVQVDK